MVVGMVSTFLLCLEYFDHQDSGTFHFQLALDPCHNASRTSSLRNPEPRNSLPYFEKKEFNTSVFKIKSHSHGIAYC